MIPDSYVFGMLLLLLMVGLCIGSFMNVVIYRLPRMIYAQDDTHFSLALPASHCPSCRAPIRWYDNIPLLSWLLLRGKCRHCASAISFVYPLSELVTGLWFAGCFLLVAFVQDKQMLTAEFYVALLPALLLFCLLYCICMIDMQHYLIPDALSYPLLWAGLLFSVLRWIPVAPEQAVIGYIIIWLVMWLLQYGYRAIRKIEGLGSGDVKLFAAAMPWLGMEKMPWLVMVSAIIGIVAYAGMKLYQRNMPPVAPQHQQQNASDPLMADSQLAEGQLAAGHSADAQSANAQSADSHSAENYADIDDAVYADIDQGRHFPFGPAIALTTLILFFV